MAKHTIPKQVIVVTKKSSNQTIDLLHGSSIILYQEKKKFPQSIEKKYNLNLVSFLESFCKLSAAYFQKRGLEAEIAVHLASNSMGDIARILIENKLVTAANRIVGAFEAIGKKEKAQQIILDMKAAGFIVRPENPFVKRTTFYFSDREKITSPYAGRIRAMWQKMRPIIIKNFSPPLGLGDQKKSLAIINHLYNQDAYHSLSIEGYHVTAELIEKIKNGKWDPLTHNSDNEQKNAMAAKGYFLAFKSVISSMQRLFKGEHAGVVFEQDLQNWYRDLFTPLVQARLIPAYSLGGYRNQQVYISNSRHVPPPIGAVLDSMEVLFQLLKEEESAAVRAILGHFIFVYIHPYMDGNGRLGRFLMNLMLISGGYQWTVIRISERLRYMRALESASVGFDILPFTKFVKSEMEYWSQFLLKHPFKHLR